VDAEDFLYDVNDLVTTLWACAIGSRKDVTVSALAIIQAHVCLMGVTETEARADADKVSEAIQENIGKLADFRGETAPRLH
jgi:hypothetical protein